MKIKTDKQHRDIYAVTIDQDEAMNIIADRVAEKAGVNLNHDGVTFRAWVSSRDTSTGILYDVKVEIIDDHTHKPTAA